MFFKKYRKGNYISEGIRKKFSANFNYARKNLQRKLMMIKKAMRMRKFHQTRISYKIAALKKVSKK